MFHWAINLSILLNIIILALDSYPYGTRNIEFYSQVFFYIFAAEMFLKLVGLGWDGYKNSWFNLFDAVIVIVLAVDTGLSYTGGEESEFATQVSILRSLRMARVCTIFKLAKDWR